MPPTFIAPYSQNNFFYPAPGRPMSGKKRPMTGQRKNLGIIPTKKSLQPKNPNTLDLEVSRMRPRIIH